MAKNSRNKKFDTRSFHRVLGLWLFIFVVVAAVTGVMRANAKAWYWKDRPSLEKAKALTEPEVSIGKAMDIYRQRFPQAEINQLQLKNFLGRPVYQVETKKGKKERLIIDAGSGVVLSPITEDAARQVANSYVDAPGLTVEIEKRESFRARKNQDLRPVFAVRFNDRVTTEVFIDRETGEVLNVLDDGKRLGLWVNKLHELDFGGMSRALLTISGIAIVLLSIVGLVLGLARKQKFNS